MKIITLAMLAVGCSFDLNGIPRPEGGPQYPDSGTVGTGGGGGNADREPDVWHPPDAMAAGDTEPWNCDGKTGTKCPRGYLCDHPAGTCDQADVGGVCIKVPSLSECPKDWLPVCGCRTNPEAMYAPTYSNDCVRLAVQNQKDHDGPCPM